MAPLTQTRASPPGWLAEDDALAGGFGWEGHLAFKPAVLPLGAPGRARGHGLEGVLEGLFGGELFEGGETTQGDMLPSGL